MKKSFLFLVLVFAAGLLLLWPSDEARIRKLFKEGAKAAESRDIDGVMSRISYNYRDDYGLTYLSLREMLKREFGSLTDIQIEPGELKVRILKDASGKGDQGPAASPLRAEAEVKVRVIATQGNETGYIIGDVRSPLSLRLILEKERTKWLIVKAEGFRDPKGRGLPEMEREGAGG
ncbi:MAG: hypothetical protein M1497_13660 [Nitrospirae bacterium]|nr:hypothetical protein [Nitrospirota bacterium]